MFPIGGSNAPLGPEGDRRWIAEGAFVHMLYSFNRFYGTRQGFPRRGQYDCRP
jgi:hypothetical protein